MFAKHFLYSGKRPSRPVLIDITKNAQLQLFDYAGYENAIMWSYRPAPIVRREYVEEAARLINEAERPLWYSDKALLGKAEKEFKAFIEKQEYLLPGQSWAYECHPNRSSVGSWYVGDAWKLWPQCVNQWMRCLDCSGYAFWWSCHRPFG